jgi:NitT/TauT family transport system substrate-binding protein
MRSFAKVLLAALAPESHMFGAVVPGAATTRIKVGTMPVVDLAPLYAAMDQGYFRDERIDLEITTVAGTSEAVIPPLAAGKIDIGFSNIVTVMKGVESGVDLRVVAPGTAMPEGNDVNPCVVLKEGPVKEAKDLEGRKVAVNSLNSIVWLYTRAFLEKKGANLSKIRFVEMPFGQMLDALLSGQIDAACPTEPYFAKLIQSGKIKVLGFPYHEITENLQSVMGIAKAEWVRNNGDVLKRFMRAYLKGVAYIEQHRTDAEGVRIIAAYTKMDPATVAKIVLPKFPSVVRPEGIEETARLMVKCGLLKKMPDVNSIVSPTAVGRPEVAEMQ